MNKIEDEGVCTIVHLTITNYDKTIGLLEPEELVETLKQVVDVLDQLSDTFGLTIVETYGKSFVICGGLQLAENKYDPSVITKHHSVRATDFSCQALNQLKKIKVKYGKQLMAKAGIHTERVTSSLLGDLKP
mmetsp:Transcript_8785/g.13557  ORF Transcript_8785/g.13557 Transcript_8785/m.13557 type:complete len:132 (+) Transcript_8785:2342-2737(+)